MPETNRQSDLVGIHPPAENFNEITSQVMKDHSTLIDEIGDLYRQKRNHEN